MSKSKEELFSIHPIIIVICKAMSELCRYTTRYFLFEKKKSGIAAPAPATPAHQGGGVPGVPTFRAIILYIYKAPFQILNKNLVFPSKTLQQFISPRENPEVFYV